MASKYTKIPKSVDDLKGFLEYYRDDYSRAANSIKEGEGWSIRFYAREVYSIIYNLHAHLYDDGGLYPLLLNDNPVADAEIVNRIENIYKQFEPKTKVFDRILAKKPAEEKVLSMSEGIVYELLTSALLKIHEVLELVAQELNVGLSNEARPATDDAVTSQPQALAYYQSAASDYLIAIVTVTDEEMSAVRANIRLSMLKLKPGDYDSSVYYSGTLDCNPALKFIVAQAPHQGVPSASALVTKLVLKFQPKMVVMLGHAAGNKNLLSKLKLGHILVAEESVNYNQIHYLQKKDESGENVYVKKDKKNTIEIEPYFKAKLKNFYATPGVLAAVRDSYVNKDYFEKLEVHCGKIITGDALMSSEDRFNELATENPGTVGLDMETYGVYYAAKYTLHKEKPYFVAIKSVSDYGSHQPKFQSNQTVLERQQYACHTSVKFFVDFCCQNDLP